MHACTTVRMSGMSIPKPNAEVANTTSTDAGACGSSRRACNTSSRREDDVPPSTTASRLKPCSLLRRSRLRGVSVPGRTARSSRRVV